MNQADLHSFLDSKVALPRTTTLLRESGLPAVLFHLKAGEELPKHHTRGGITVQSLAGQSILLAGDERVEMTPALLISLAPGIPHRVIAQEDTLLLVTIWEPMPAQT
jgi:quercetin dioxygenase-like cupin family protein